MQYGQCLSYNLTFYPLLTGVKMENTITNTSVNNNNEVNIINEEYIVEENESFDIFDTYDDDLYNLCASVERELG